MTTDQIDPQHFAELEHEFLKAAAASNVDLAKLDNEQIAGLWDGFVEDLATHHNVAKLAAGDVDDMDDEEFFKAASADISDHVEAIRLSTIELFEKCASLEGIDIDALEPAVLEQEYSNFARHLLPLRMTQSLTDKQASAQPTAAELEEMQAKIAEADFLGARMGEALLATVQGTKEAKAAHPDGLVPESPSDLGSGTKTVSPGSPESKGMSNTTKALLGTGAVVGTGLAARALYKRRKARKDAEKGEPEASKEATAAHALAVIRSTY